MYYAKKKRIIIASIVVVLLVILIAGGLFVYFATDILKSDKELFLKYASKQYTSITENNNNQIKDIINVQKIKNSETDANISIRYDNKNEDSKEISKALEKLKINLNSKKDIENDREFTNLKIDYQNDNLLDINYLKSEDIYALKWEEIINKYYVGIKNENLRVLAQKLGISDTSELPDKIETSNISKELKITEEEQKYISDTYLNIIVNNIAKEKYSKHKNMLLIKNGEEYNTTAYRLELTAEDMRNLEILLLENLSQDSITLNLIATKAKALKLSEDYTTISGIVNKIENLIKTLKNSEIDSSKGLTIIIYESKGDILQTDIIFVNELKVSMEVEKENNIKTIKFDILNLSNNDTFYTAKLNIRDERTDESIDFGIFLNIDNITKIELNSLISGLASNDNVNSKIKVSVENEEEQAIEVLYEAKTKYGDLSQEITKLDSSNTVTLNDYSKEAINNFMNALEEKIEETILKKLIILGIKEEPTQEIDNSLQENQ